jgi:hypothetical protein
MNSSIVKVPPKRAQAIDFKDQARTLLKLVSKKTVGLAYAGHPKSYST